MPRVNELYCFKGASIPWALIVELLRPTGYLPLTIEGVPMEVVIFLDFADFIAQALYFCIALCSGPDISQKV